MTLFDIIGLVILGVSVVAGLARGAVREVSHVGAFVLAVFAATFALRYTGPMAVAAVKPHWAANTVALALVFLAVYLVLRLAAAALTRGLRQTKTLGAVDRLIGGGFGLVRALVVLGVIGLMLNAAMPNGAAPSWITQAKLYPLSKASAVALKALAPKGASLAGQLKPQVDAAVSAEDRPGGDASPATSSAVGQSDDIGYTAAARKGLDDVVEKTR
ncbi:MAG: CvpA family protein [Caulobacteraceae bacterium]|nr:CvpA family protein [Caulobacteraceae bacterium]